MKFRARGRVRADGEMNKLETDYAGHLSLRLHAGEVLWFKFESIKLRLARNTFYTVDFFVMLTDGTLEAHEVKGFWEEDARVKIKVAAAMFPFQFVGVKRESKQWVFEQF